LQERGGCRKGEASEKGRLQERGGCRNGRLQERGSFRK